MENPGGVGAAIRLKFWPYISEADRARYLTPRLTVNYASSLAKFAKNIKEPCPNRIF